MSQPRTNGEPPEAEEVVIPLDNVDWSRFDSEYRDWQDKPTHPMYAEWKKRKQEHLESAAQRIKDEFLMGKVVWEGYRGKLPLHVIYGETLREYQSVSHVNYQVKSTKPEGKVRVAGTTRLVLTLYQPP